MRSHNHVSPNIKAEESDNHGEAEPFLLLVETRFLVSCSLGSFYLPDNLIARFGLMTYIYNSHTHKKEQRSTKHNEH